MFQMQIQLQPDKTEASVSLPTMASPLKMSAEELSDLIRQLAWLRASMLPEYPRENMKSGTQVSSVPAVHWQVTEDAIPEQFRLHLLHPGFGWLAIPMDESNFDQMSAAAAQILRTPIARH
jgi:hypothetical protein